MSLLKIISDAFNVAGFPTEETVEETARAAAVEHALSFAVITQESDAHYLPDMMASLPHSVEVVIVNTIKCKSGEEERTILRVDSTIQDGRTIRVADYHYTRWSFARARNVSIDLCRREWVFWLDSDDRLVPSTHEQILAVSELSPCVGGVVMGCFGYQPPYEDGKRGAYYATPHLRIFRRSTGANFRGIVHEQIDSQITGAGYTVVECAAPVLHVGYEIDVLTMIGKLERNVSLLCQQLALDPDYLPQYYRGALTSNLATLNDMKGN